jgi:hypothetical protein
VVLTYTATARAKPQPNPKVKGIFSVTARRPIPGAKLLGECVLEKHHALYLVGLRVMFDGGAPIREDINAAPYCNPPVTNVGYTEITCSHVPFEVTIPGPEPTNIAVAPLWQDEPGGCMSAVVQCSAGGKLPLGVPDSGHKAAVTQALDYPLWDHIPNDRPNPVAGEMPPMASSGDAVTVNSTESYQATWTITLSNIKSCASGQQVRVCSSVQCAYM